MVILKKEITTRYCYCVFLPVKMFLYLKKKKKSFQTAFKKMQKHLFMFTLFVKRLVLESKPCDKTRKATL